MTSNIIVLFCVAVIQSEESAEPRCRPEQLWTVILHTPIQYIMNDLKLGQEAPGFSSSSLISLWRRGL